MVNRDYVYNLKRRVYGMSSWFWGYHMCANTNIYIYIYMCIIDYRSYNPLSKFLVDLPKAGA